MAVGKAEVGARRANDASRARRRPASATLSVFPLRPRRGGQLAPCHAHKIGEPKKSPQLCKFLSPRKETTSVRRETSGVACRPRMRGFHGGSRPPAARAPGSPGPASWADVLANADPEHGQPSTPRRAGTASVATDDDEMPGSQQLLRRPNRPAPPAGGASQEEFHRVLTAAVDHGVITADQAEQAIRLRRGEELLPLEAPLVVRRNGQEVRRRTGMWEVKSGPHESRDAAKKALLSAGSGDDGERWKWNRGEGAKHLFRCATHKNCAVMARLTPTDEVEVLQVRTAPSQSTPAAPPPGLGTGLGGEFVALVPRALLRCTSHPCSDGL